MKRKDPGESTVTRGSGNVFADLGLPDAELLQVKSSLIFQIMRAVEARGLSDSAAAQILGIDEAAVASLFSGRGLNTASDQLIEMLDRLDCKVEVRVKPRRPLRKKPLQKRNPTAVVTA